MKIQTLVMGDYGSPPVRFCLYLFPTPLTPPLSTSPEQSQPRLIRQYRRDSTHQQDKNDADTRNFRFLCLEDLESLFFRYSDDAAAAKRELEKAYHEHPSWFCTDQAGGRSYVMTRAVAHVANQLAIDTLAGLCNFTENDLCSGYADDLLRRITDLRPITVSVIEQEFIPTRLIDSETRFRVQQIPASSSSSLFIRLSPPSENITRFDPCRDDIVQKNRSSLSTMPHPAKDASMTESEPHMLLPRPSSLLLKRSAHPLHKAPPNLTILTPSYGAADPASIHSAPLHPRGHKHNPVTATHLKHRVIKVVKRAPPATAAPWSIKQHQAAATAMATISTAHHGEFPSPPIVPSQQRYENLTSIKTATLLPPPPKTPSASSFSKKQQFMQPFETLYDNIEHTRSLKSTLDDHIRRSSTLIQTLQSSSTMVEALVRRHVRESMQQQLQEYINRIESLEHRILSSPPPLKEKHTQDNGSNNNIKSVLSELVDRLDLLESKMDTRR